MTEKELEKTKELVNDYCQCEFHHDANFDDLESVGVAYTTLTDEEIPIQVSLDLIHMKKKVWIGTDITDGIEPDEVEDITMEDLECLDFDDLICGWQTYIEDNIEKYLK